MHELGGLDLDTLSVGMSDDLEAAVCEGSTMVRMGTAVFGARPVRTPRPGLTATPRCLAVLWSPPPTGT